MMAATLLMPTTDFWHLFPDLINKKLFETKKVKIKRNLTGWWPPPCCHQAD